MKTTGVQQQQQALQISKTQQGTARQQTKPAQGQQQNGNQDVKVSISAQGKQAQKNSQTQAQSAATNLQSTLQTQQAGYSRMARTTAEQGNKTATSGLANDVLNKM